MGQQSRETRLGRYYSRCAVSLCVQCGETAQEGTTRCARCTLGQKYHREQSYWQRVARGVCTRCGKRPVTRRRNCLRCRREASTAKLRRKSNGSGGGSIF